NCKGLSVRGHQRSAGHLCPAWHEVGDGALAGILTLASGCRAAAFPLAVVAGGLLRSGGLSPFHGQLDTGTGLYPPQSRLSGDWPELRAGLSGGRDSALV